MKMFDQARKLRKMFPGGKKDIDQEGEMEGKVPDRSRVISVASGKGGVGKTNIVVNLALALQNLNRDVLILDADMGMANIDVVMGITPKYHLGHVLENKCNLEDALVSGPSGLDVLPGASGVDDFTGINFGEVKRLLELSSAIEASYDFIMLDIGAGVHQGVVNFIRAADEILVVLTPEPTAVMDAYSLIKILAGYDVSSQLNLIVNQVESRSEGEDVSGRMKNAINDYLEINVEKTALIPYDDVLRKSVREQEPLMQLYPNSKAGRAFSQIAEMMADGAVKENSRGMKGFVYRMLGFFKDS